MNYEMLYNRSIGYSLHGFWPRSLKSPSLSPIGYDVFVSTTKFKLNFFDTTTINSTIGCGKYREYVKHGARSGYSYQQWMENVNKCLPPIYPHQM